MITMVEKISTNVAAMDEVRNVEAIQLMDKP